MVYWAEPAQGLALSRIVNDSLYEISSLRPDRFVPVGSVPLQDTDLAIQELRRISADLGIRAVILGSNIDGTELDAPRLEPFYAEADRLGVGLFVHPIVEPAVADRMRDYRLDMGFGMVADTTIAISRVICSGLMDRHPGLRIWWSHLGGALPFVGDRIQYFLERLPGSTYRAADPFDSYVARFWFDTVVYSDRMLAAGLMFARPDRLMFGTDTPFMGDSTPDIRRFIDGSPDLSGVDRVAIYSRNAAEFLGLDLSGPEWADPDTAGGAR
jgi:aminocarboxymuconate-semialdehyde decarboxylase